MTHAIATDAPEAAQKDTGFDRFRSDPTRLQTAWAWGLSLLAHALFLAGMFAVVFPYSPKPAPPLPITRAVLIGDPEATSLAMNSMPDWQPEAASPRPDPLKFSPNKLRNLPSLADRPKPELSIIGLGSGGGDFSAYGLGISGDAGPDFFGVGSTAKGVRRIVYVVDRSGSMLGTFGYVRKELKRSIEKLRRSQQFHVIFFNTGAPLENPPGKLVSAVRAHKEKLFDFVDQVQPNGGTEPGPAMRRAFDAGAEMIYFLTDGQFDRKLVAQLEEWNADRRVRIFTIAFVGAGGAEVLEEIARKHGGEFRFVTEDDLP